MTEIEVLNIIKKNEINKDELDNFWDNMFGFLPLIMLLFIAENNIGFLIIVCLLIIYTFYCKFNERKLFRIKTANNKFENIELIKNISEKQNWKMESESFGYYQFYVPFIFGRPGHKLTLILDNNEILLNLRNLGSSKGRMPYLFGIDTFTEKKIINLLNVVE
ncbi:hypothetical protein [Flavobacterium sp. GP15]|uniref:hypothetical protein n=1 Tax=Flavobacterium sp. GP15 TaxID=2758567 RepID=UPI00165E54E5|nr:hypothetical protein [Flavobacterium sp. GP15]